MRFSDQWKLRRVFTTDALDSFSAASEQRTLLICWPSFPFLAKALKWNIDLVILHKRVLLLRVFKGESLSLGSLVNEDSRCQVN